MGFGEWLRANSEHYLLESAQAEMARRYLPPDRQPGTRRGAFLWRRLFVPVYRRVPWGVRRAIISIMPGSHRQTWTRRSP